MDSGAGLTEDVEDGGVETGDGLLQEEDRGERRKSKYQFIPENELTSRQSWAG